MNEKMIRSVLENLAGGQAPEDIPGFDCKAFWTTIDTAYEAGQLSGKILLARSILKLMDNS